MNTKEIEIKREVFDENSSETNEIQTRPLISKLVEYTGGGRKRSISSIEEQNQHGKFDFKTAFIKSEPLEDDVMQNDESCGDFDNNNADIAKIKQEHIEFDLDIVKEEISDVARIKQERIEISDRYKSENQAKPPSDDASPPKKRRASVKDEVRDTPEYEVSLDIPPDVRVGVPDRRRTVRLLTEEEASRLPITVPTPRGQKAKPGELPKKKGKAYSCKDCSQVFSAFADLRTHSIVHQVETRIPDNSVRNSGRHSWSKEDMAKAIESVQQKKMGWLKASTTFNVPQATLRRHFRNVPVNLGRFKPTFQLDIEKQLVEHLLYFENSLFAFNATDVRKLVYEFAKKAGLPNRFDEGKQMAGWDWLKGFRKRNPVISSKIPEATSAAMAKAFNKTRVMKFYELLENMVTANDIPSSRIYNMDESELKPPKVGGEPGQRVSIAVCANAAGSCIPPAMIIPRKNFEPEYFDGAPPGTLQLCYDRGYMVGELFVQWIKHFVRSTGCSTANKVILILDGHSSHKNLEALEFAKTSGVILLCLPSHCTHQMQPLEISFFGPLHACYEEEISTWLNTHPGRTVGLYQMAGIFGRAYESAASVRNITSGFEKAGIYPLNAPIFPDRLFLPSEVMENVSEMQHNKEKD